MFCTVFYHVYQFFKYQLGSNLYKPQNRKKNRKVTQIGTFEVCVPVNSIFLISGTITFSHSIGKKMKHRYQSFTRIGRQFQSLERQVYADWTSDSFPLCQRSCFIRRTMVNNDEYTDEYNDEYLCRDFFVGFNFWSRLSFQISEFRVHCCVHTHVALRKFIAQVLASQFSF